MEGIDRVVKGGGIEGRRVEGVAVGGGKIAAEAASTTVPSFPTSEKVEERRKDVARNETGVSDH